MLHYAFGFSFEEAKTQNPVKLYCRYCSTASCRDTASFLFLLQHGKLSSTRSPLNRYMGLMSIPPSRNCSSLPSRVLCTTQSA